MKVVHHSGSETVSIFGDGNAGENMYIIVGVPRTYVHGSLTVLYTDIGKRTIF